MRRLFSSDPILALDAPGRKSYYAMKRIHGQRFANRNPARLRESLGLARPTIWPREASLFIPRRRFAKKAAGVHSNFAFFFFDNAFHPKCNNFNFMLNSERSSLFVVIDSTQPTIEMVRFCRIAIPVLLSFTPRVGLRRFGAPRYMSLRSSHLSTYCPLIEWLYFVCQELLTQEIALFRCPFQIIGNLFGDSQADLEFLDSIPANNRGTLNWKYSSSSS